MSDTELVQNPAYNIAVAVKDEPRRVILSRPRSVIVMEQDNYIGAESEERIGKSSKWDHHLTLATLVTVLSVFALNFFGIFCGVAAIYFAYKGRVASQNGEYAAKIENERSSFASVVICLIMWILTWCVIGFGVHYHFCGVTGSKCETRTHI